MNCACTNNGGGPRLIGCYKEFLPNVILSLKEAGRSNVERQPTLASCTLARTHVNAVPPTQEVEVLVAGVRGLPWVCLGELCRFRRHSFRGP